MVFRRGLAFLCVAAAVALADVAVDAKEHQAAVKESKIEYPNGVVLISSKDDAKPKAATDKKHAKHASKKHAKAIDDDSSDDVAAAKHHKKKSAPKSKKAEETTAADGEVTRKYAHGTVRIFKQASDGAATAKGKQVDAHVHKKEVTHEVHATTSKRAHTHAKGASGDVTKDFELKEGVNKFSIEGVPLQVTVDHGKVDVSVNGQHVQSGSEIKVEAPEVDAKKDAPTTKKQHHDKKQHDKKQHSKKVKAAAAPKPEEVSVSAPADQAKAAVDDKAERVTALATKLSKNNHGIFETTPVMVICGIIGTLAAVVGIAAVAVTRTRGVAAEDGNLQSVLADSSELDLEAAAQDAPADQSDSLEDSSDDDDAEAGEGTFANNERAGTVSV